MPHPPHLLHRRAGSALAATLFLVLGSFGPGQTIVDAFQQGSEAEYLSSYPSLIASSYSAVDDPAVAPPGLLSACRDKGLNTFAGGSEIVLQPDGTDAASGVSTVSASGAESQCGGPTSASVCVVPSGLRLVMSSSIHLSALIVRGELLWRDADQPAADQWLCAGYVAVEDDGKFVMNLSEKKGWVYVKNNGAVHPVGRERFFGGAAPHHGDVFEHGGGPTVRVTGRKLKRTWSLLSKPFLTGETSLKLLHSPVRMGWKVGDRIGVSPTKPDSDGTGQTFRIVSVSDDGTVTLDGAAAEDRKADFLPPAKTGPASSEDPFSAALLSAEVVNLSRNVVITGDNLSLDSCDSSLTEEAVQGSGTSTQGCMCANGRSKCTVGHHVAQMHAGTMSIKNARVEKCGQRGIEGKYCLHFHKLGDCPSCAFEGNALEYGHQRGIIVHGTHRSTVENNVLWDIRGAGIYIEDGNEMHNHIKYNVVTCPWRFDDHVMQGCTIPGTSNTQADTSNNQAGIYTETAANDLIGNRASNSFNGMFLQANGQGRGSVYGKVCTNHLAFGRWEGNTFHGHKRFGTYTLGGSEPRNTDQSIANNGFNTDRANTCAAATTGGLDNGAPVSVLNNVDYDNVFVGHYTAGDMQHRGHTSVGSNNLIYWKETKNFADGCAAHISDAYYESGTMALPDQGTFIIQDTTFGGNVLLEANHHCNVGTTGFLCMPQYVLHNVKWRGGRSGTWIWLQRGGTGGGGVFTLSPPGADAVMAATPEEREAMKDMIFPPGYVSLASGHYTYLLSAPNGLCVYAASIKSEYGSRYDGGILCKVPLRVLKVWSRGLATGSAPSLNVEAWVGAGGVAVQDTTAPTASQTVNFHSAGGSGEGKQGYALPVVPRSDVSYRLSLTSGDGSIPADWIVEFSDPVVGHRWGEEFVQLTVRGRDCGPDGRVSSQHDRRYVGGIKKGIEAWGNHGACLGAAQPPNMDDVDCDAVGGGKAGAVPATSCPELCTSSGGCDSSTSFCHCGTATCQCKPGFAGSDCSVDLCAAARCGDHGTCAALYLGTTSTLPVTDPDNACICDEGWFGPLCDRPDPCLTSGRTCSGNGVCASNGYVDYCECNEGYSGENCEVGCDGQCQGSYPYGCATSLGGIVKYKCGPDRQCQYLAEGETGTESWCTYKDDSTQDSVCECPSDSDCEATGVCNQDGTCPDPTRLADETPCNSKPFGTCQGGVCVEPPTSAPAPEPTPSPVTAAPVPAPVPVAPTDAPVTSPVAPPTQESCEGKCAGNPPYFGCAGVQINNAVRQTCDPNGGGGCQYLAEGQESTWCTYLTFSPPAAPTEAPVPAPTDKPTDAPVPPPPTVKPTDAPVAPPTQESCEGKCAGTPPYFGCAGVQINNAVRQTCDPNGGGGCQYLAEGQESTWCTYLTFSPPAAPTEAPVPAPTDKPTDAPVPPPPTEKPTDAPISLPAQENCEGRCVGSGPNHNCAWWPIEGKAFYACDPNGGRGCQYLAAGQTTSWCVYKTFAPTPPPTEAPVPAPTEKPTNAPTPQAAESCEGRCAGTGPSFGCAWWPMEGKAFYACDPNGGGGCSYLAEGESTSWCIYMTFP